MKELKVPTLTDEEAEKLKAAYYDLFRVAPGTETWAMAGLPSFEAVQAIFASPGPALRGEGGSSSASLPSPSSGDTDLERARARKDHQRAIIERVTGLDPSRSRPPDDPDQFGDPNVSTEWVRVPREPTNEMCAKGALMLDKDDAGEGHGYVRGVWWAMLDALPEPPALGWPLEGQGATPEDANGMPKDSLPPDVKAAVERLTTETTSWLEQRIASCRREANTDFERVARQYDQRLADLRTLLQSHTALTEANERLRADAARYDHLREHCSYHYGMSMVEPSPAEWGIQWSFQQTKPGEQLESIDSLIDADIAALLARQAIGEGEDRG